MLTSLSLRLSMLGEVEQSLANEGNAKPLLHAVLALLGSVVMVRDEAGATRKLSTS